MPAAKKDTQQCDRLAKALRKQGCSFYQGTKHNGFKVHPPECECKKLPIYTWHKNDQHLHTFVRHIIDNWSDVINFDIINLPCINKKCKTISKKKK